MNNFKYSIPTIVLFGENVIENLGELITEYSQNILLLYGGGSIKKIDVYNKVINIFNEYKINFKELGGIKPNPDITSARTGIKIMRENKLDFILAVGGGSVIDCAKCISAGLYYDGDPWDFPMRKAKIKKTANIGTILTLSATGSEMNSGAVISNQEKELKLAMGNPKLAPKFSLLDPTYTYSVPKDQTAAGVVDIMSHLFEQYFSPTPNTFIQDKMTEALLKTCIEFGEIAIKEPKNYNARANLMWASSLALNGMLSCGKIGDWATHRIEHELSAIYDITHGLGLAILTPNWMRYVLNNENVTKFANYGRNVWNINIKDNLECAKKAITKTREYFKSLGLASSLSEIGIDDKKFDQMAKNAVQFNDLGVLKKLSYNDVINILKNSLH